MNGLPLRLTLTAARCATLLAAAVLCFALPAYGQLSLTSAVDLALTNNPRVKTAQADAARSLAAYQETKDAYIPSLNAGAGLGQSYGYSFNPPTLFTFNAGSLVYSAAQFNYIRSARSGLTAAQLALQDMREAVAEDAALTFVALTHDQKREAVLAQQNTDAEKLVTIVTDRLNAGQDSAVDLTQAKLTAAQLRLSRLRAQDDTANDRLHLERILGIPEGPFQAQGGFPTLPLPADLLPNGSSNGTGNAAVAAAFANANAKLQQSYGDSHFLYRPQVQLVIQYNRYATFTNSFKQIQQEYSTTGQSIGADEEVLGVSISLPLFDRARKAKARESVADAAHALHEAETTRITILDAQSKLSHSIAELSARAEVAQLEQQLAKQQLDVLELQLNSAPTGNGPLMTPKDEQNQRIAERDKYLAVIDTDFQLQQAEISLLRQTGRLEEWLHEATLNAVPVPPPTPQP